MKQTNESPIERHAPHDAEVYRAAAILLCDTVERLAIDNRRLRSLIRALERELISPLPVFENARRADRLG